MKRLLVLFIAALLLTTIMTAQIQGGKKQSSPTKPKTEQKARPKQSTPSSNSGKSKKSTKTTKQTTKQQSSNRSSSSTTTRLLPAVVQQAIDDMVYVEGGTFTMGATKEQDRKGYRDEEPAHQVTLSSYYIGKYEVTQGLWQAVMGTTVRQQRDKEHPYYTRNLDYLYGEGANYPMYYIDWRECQEFISKLNQLTGKHFRLPTEAEWEYAARGGNRSRGYKYVGCGYMYAGNNDIDEVAWFDRNSGGTTHPVGQKAPNELGLYDMSGNVSEWCQDWYTVWYSSDFSSIQRNPTGPSFGTERVCRGGAWDCDAKGCRVSRRYEGHSRYGLYPHGFRLAL